VGGGERVSCIKQLLFFFFSFLIRKLISLTIAEKRPAIRKKEIEQEKEEEMRANMKKRKKY
jgi:hypothetical protein